MDLDPDPMTTIGASEDYKAKWHEKYGKDAPEPAEEEFDLNKDPASTIGATEAYKAAWHKEYGNAEPAGNASKAEWVNHAVLQGASREEAEASTVADLKAAYGGSGVASAPSQGSSLPAGTTTATSDPAPGGGVNSGTAGGTATTTGTSSAGAAAKA